VRDYSKDAYHVTNNPYTSCKDCCGSPGAADCGKVATSDHDDCATCAGGQYQVTGASSCTDCQPCSSGSERSGCGKGAAGDCSLCSVGHYKIKGLTGTGNYEDKCLSCTGCPLGKERSGVLDPCVRGGGGADSDTSTCVGCGTGFYQSTGVSSRTSSYYPTNAILDKCELCSECKPGGIRKSCSDSNQGHCQPWSKPVVTAVSGSGKEGGSTTGNQPLIIEGFHFGAVLAGGRADIIVRYGPKDDIGRYVLDNGSPSNVFPPCKIVEHDVDSQKATMQCTTTAGVGKGHWIQVQVGTDYTSSDECLNGETNCKIKTSVEFDAQIAYARPIVARYEVGNAPANQMLTLGAETLVVEGSNFGPPGTPVDSAVYGDQIPPQYAATNCVVFSHVQMSCTTAPGAGANHKLVVTIDGQQSTVPAVGYGVPVLLRSECDATGANKLACHCVSNGPGVQGSKCSGYLDGNGKNYVPAVTIGATPCEATATIPCAAPTATASDSAGVNTISTRGGQRVILSGINVGSSSLVGGVSVLDLEEIRMGPSPTSSRVLPLIFPTTSEWLANNVEPGCVLYVPHFSVLCNTPPGIGRDNYFFLTVDGQQMMLDTGGGDAKQGTTPYGLPTLQSLTPKNSIIRTNGGDLVVITGLDFGMLSSDVKIEAWLYRVGENTPSFKSGAGSGLVVLSPRANMIDAIEVPVPTGYGTYNVFLHVVNTVTGQVEDSSNSVQLRYDRPRITATTIIAGGAENAVSISGVNFCVNKDCGELFICDGVTSCGECFTGVPPAGPNDPPQDIANLNNLPLGTTNSWSHSFAQVSTSATAGCVYVRVGTNPQNYQYSNAVSFTTTNPLILQGYDLDAKSTAFVSRTAAYPTSALDQDDTPIRMKLVVSNLQDPDSSNTQIIFGTYGCNSKFGAVLETVVEINTGHLLTVLIPEGTGTNVHVTACHNGLASAPAMIHYLPPIVASARHLPYSGSGLNDISYDGDQAGSGLPAGGASYIGFTPGQMDSAISAATIVVGERDTARTTAIGAKDTKQTAVDTVTKTLEECQNPVDLSAPAVDCTSAEDALATAQIALDAALVEVSVRERSWSAATYKLAGLNEAKVTPYTYQYVELIGSNFASSSMSVDDPFPLKIEFTHADPLVKDPAPEGMGLSWLLRSKEYGGVVSECSSTGTVPCCPVWTHTRLVCRVPPGSGKGWLFTIMVSNQFSQWPTIPNSMPYSIPEINTVTPPARPTLGFDMTVSGMNFGDPITKPTVTIGNPGAGETFCAVQSFNNDQIICRAPPGQGKDLPLFVTNGPGLVVSDSTLPWSNLGNAYARRSAPFLFSYDAPIITTMDVTKGPTSGISSELNRPVVITIIGSNFGTSNNTNLRVLFYPKGEKRTEPFIASGAMIISHDHTKIVYQLPPGYGKNCEVVVDVAGRTSTPGSTTFDYNNPEVSNVRPFCGGRQMTGTKKYLEGECYGTVAPAFSHPNHYPQIVSITVDGAGTGFIAYDVAVDDSTNPRLTLSYHELTLSSKDIVRVVGMKDDYYNRQFVVSGAPVPQPLVSATRRIVKFLYDVKKDRITAETNVPSVGNGKLSRLAKPYVRGDSTTFRLLESDGCGAVVEYTSNAGYIRSSGWEPYSSFKDRRNRAGEAAATIKRKCQVGNYDRRQRIFIEGEDLAALAPITVRLERKKCDCVTMLDGATAVPCRDKSTNICRAAGVDGTCPSNHEDCSAVNDDWEDITEEDANRRRRLGEGVGMVVEEHTDRRIVILSQRGLGRTLRLQATLGSKKLSIGGTMTLRYQPPTIRAFETVESQQGGPSNFRPGDVVALLGYNFGYGGVGISTKDLQSLITIRIGSEYDAAGNDCAVSTVCDLDKTFKKCEDLTYHSEYLLGSKSSYRGFPYLTCKTVPDVAGRKNWSLSINGNIDGCSSNSFLCADADDWPVYRTTSNPNRAVNLTDEQNDRTKGPMFTCAKESQQNQAYASTGELCVNITDGQDGAELSARCADSECTAPRALAGFWRLDLDLKFACNSDPENVKRNDKGIKEGTIPLACQNPVAKGEYDQQQGTFDKLLGKVNPLSASKTKSGVELCVSPDADTGSCPVADTQLQCDLRGAAAPAAGSCVFRRAKEARRAMGSDYTPWASVDQEATVMALEGRCASARYLHLVDPTVYDEYPQLKISPTCFDIVGCSPKDSCKGNNTCSLGYEYNKYKCELWNEENPGKQSCQKDDECRSRSGTSQNGFGSACDLDHPEDCSRCVLGEFDRLTGERNGTCECIGGAPRCGLCTQRTDFGKDDERNQKGYFRMNNECQQCPENPELIMILLALAIVFMCVGGWWAQTKKINISILSIGVDYFQILSIFASLRVKWPSWVKEVLQILSVFNLNIDIAGPECVFTDFDYKTKWMVTVLTPAIFGAVLFLMFIVIMLFKLIKNIGGCASKGVKYTSHGSKLVASFVLVFYFLYLSVTRRALDIFNCNPVDPDDGYLYTEFTSIDCEAGLCRCDDPDELQQQLVPYAILCLLCYSIGFPLYVMWITYYYRIQIKLDQLLRAHGLGEDRATSPDSVLFTPKPLFCCLQHYCSCTRSKSKEFYDIRKKHHQLYYHFKPGKVYWLTVILLRKFLIVMIALLFRANIIFMLASMLLVLFANYVMTAKHRPYMSTVERENVKESHRLKVLEAQNFIDAELPHDSIPKDSYMHYQLDPAIRRLLKLQQENTRRLGHTNVRNLSMAKNIHLTHKSAVTYYFDYNTVEIILIGCSIFLA